MLTFKGTAATVMSAISIFAFAGVAAASASPGFGQSKTRTEHIQIMSTSVRAAAASAIASGAFTAAGRAELGSARVGKLIFPAGTITVSHTQSGGSEHVNPATCLNTITQRGTYKITAGARKYSRISGHGTYRLSLVFVDARAHGQCAPGKPPVARQELLELTGPVRL
jgi:hypothetical protein